MLKAVTIATTPKSPGVRSLANTTVPVIWMPYIKICDKIVAPAPLRARPLKPALKYWFVKYASAMHFFPPNSLIQSQRSLQERYAIRQIFSTHEIINHENIPSDELALSIDVYHLSICKRIFKKAT
jgi:hypothetical protein